MRKVTIEDISRETGLSRGTVSRALNDRRDISSRTKQRVLDACTKLNYSPSSAARSLATGRNFAVALLWTAPISHYLAELFRGCAQAAYAAHYALTLIELPDAAAGSETRIRSLSAERIDGAVAASPLSEAHARILGEIVGERMIASTHVGPALRCDTFHVDDAEAGALAARRLLRCGARNSVYIVRRGDAAAKRRLAGFRDAWALDAKRGAATQPIEVELGGDLASHTATLRAVDAIASSDDRLAVAAMCFLAPLGRTAGRDVQIIGCGDEPIAADCAVPLTTIQLNAHEAGRRTTAALLERLKGERKDAPQTVAIAPEVVDRSTVVGTG